MAEKISIVDQFRGKWLGIKFVSFEMNGKTISNYEMTFRPHLEGKELDTQYVDVIPILKYKNQPSQIIVIANFRPPVMKYVLEFPSGFLQDNDIKQNAIRELKEETGYIVESFIDFPTPTLYIDPWKGNQTTKTYLAIIDGDKNTNPKQQLQNDQNIEVIRLKLDKSLHEQILELQSKRGFIIEGKLWSTCIGLNLLQLI